MPHKFPVPRIDELPLMAPEILAEPDNLPAPDTIRLNLNENPLPPSPRAIEAMRQAVQYSHRYPDHSCSALANIISKRTGIVANRIVFGNGSGEMLVASAAVALQPSDQAVLPHPTFPPVGKCVQLAGGDVLRVPVLTNGANDVSSMIDAMTERTSLFYLCTPNSPTGGLLDSDDLRLAANTVPSQCLLMVDEAYHEFANYEGGPDVLSILAERQGPWVVVRTFSKAYGLSGTRLGYALLSDDQLASGFSKMRSGFNVNRIALAGACAAMQDQAYLDHVLSVVSSERDRLTNRMTGLGLSVYPSAANFVLARSAAPAQALAAHLAAHDIMIQALPWPDELGSIRVTVGIREHNDAFLKALEAFVRQPVVS